MKFLLLCLVSLGVAQNKYKNPPEIHELFQKCLKDHQCYVPGICLNRWLDVPNKLKKFTGSTIDADFACTTGIMIKALNDYKWKIHLFKGDDANFELGLQFTRSDAVPAAECKGTVPIFGCKQGAHYPGKLKTIKSQIRSHETIIKSNEYSLCVGTIESAGDSPAKISDLFATGQFHLQWYEAAQGTCKQYTLTIPKRSKKNQWDPYQPGSCDVIDLLRNPTEQSNTEIFHPVDRSLEMINCNKMTKSNDGILYELKIKRTEKEGYEKIKKITCDTTKDQMIYYDSNNAVVNINSPLIATCAERKRCDRLPSACENCAEATYKGCDGNNQCGVIQCASNLVWVNDKLLHEGEVHCYHEDVGSDVRKHWFREVDGEKEWVFQASCVTEMDCRWDFPLVSICDDNKDCTPAIITAEGVSCRPLYDLYYQYSEDSKPVKVPNGIACNKTSGNWIVDDMGTDLRNVLCLLNHADKRERFKQEALQRHTSEDDGTAMNIGLALSILVIFIVDIIVMVSIYFYNKVKHRQRIVDYKFRKMDPAIVVTPKVQHCELRAHPDRQLITNDLATLSPEALCNQILAEWRMYSILEKGKFLEHVIREFGITPFMVRKSIPLFKLCIKESNYHILKILMNGLKMIEKSCDMSKKKELGSKTRDAIGNLGLILMRDLSWEQFPQEPQNVTQLRMFAAQALLYSDNSEAIEKLLEMHDRNGGMVCGVDSSLRKTVWAAVVSRRHKFSEIEALFEKESKMPRQPITPDEEFVGTKLEHLIYALCSGTRAQAETIMNRVINEPGYTGREILAGFTAMLEDFPHNHIAARFLFIERIARIKKKMPVGSDLFQILFASFYRYAMVAPNDNWFIKFVTGVGTFTTAEKGMLDIVTAFQFSETYSTAHTDRNIPLLLAEVGKLGKRDKLEINKQNDEELMAPPPDAPPLSQAVAAAASIRKETRSARRKRMQTEWEAKKKERASAEPTGEKGDKDKKSEKKKKTD